MNEITAAATSLTGGVIDPFAVPLINTAVSYGGAFLGGLLSFFSPCVLPLIPVFFGVLMGSAKKPIERFWKGVFFTTGMSIFFFLLGTGAGGLGQFIGKNRLLMNAISGGLFILFAFLYLFEVGFKGVKVNVFKFKGGLLSGFLLGSVLGMIWVPCAGPILGSILVLAANQNTAGQGGLLLLVYSFGLSIPFLTLSGVVAKLTSKLTFGGESKIRVALRLIVFALLFTAGILTMFDKLNLLQITF
ncbi:cytochrome C biogenesis protein [Kosmotoga arenicorallina S304]|uniref:Cytochrome C biogenesis protein n=1 Tax=Kosmotoga arenicorallina S304 TaxID=1453497 RepID=A0A176JXP8_9BACT|nr:cytochrome c biogenesis CcdA family protein [Kosmotoga arenicorallina]OAA28488.1 cytochrome C biogenesis protein [Kosmotoga arenicorallina S304]